MTKKTVKKIVFAAAVLLLLLWAFMPRNLASVLKVDERFSVRSGLMTFTLEKGNCKHEVLDLDVEAGSEAANALLQAVREISCRPTLNPFPSRTIYVTGVDSVEITWQSETTRVRINMMEDRSTAVVNRRGRLPVFVLEEGAYAQLAAVFEAYGVLNTEID